MKYAWIQEQRDLFPIVAMCRILQVSTSGYYTWHDREPGPRAERTQRIQAAVRVVHAESHGMHGSVKITRALHLRDDVEQACRNTVANPRHFPLHPEAANDDAVESDETSPNSEGVFYSHDVPGWLVKDDVNGNAGVWNFVEFVRVSFYGAEPSGTGVAGSRASGRVEWHSMANLKLVGGKLQRTTGDAEESLENNIALGHVLLQRPGT